MVFSFSDNRPGEPAVIIHADQPTVARIATLEAEVKRLREALHCCCYVRPCGDTCGAHAVEPRLPCNCDELGATEETPQ